MPYPSADFAHFFRSNSDSRPFAIKNIRHAMPYGIACRMCVLISVYRIIQLRELRQRVPLLREPQLQVLQLRERLCGGCGE